jgi:predicted ATP-binding protein involved in virulence
MTITITLNEDCEKPETVAYIKNVVEGFRIYQNLYFKDEFLENVVSQRVYRKIKICDVNKLLLQLTHFHIYLNYYKDAIIENSTFHRYNHTERLLTRTNESDYIRLCNSCMALNKRFDETKLKEIMKSIALKTENDIDDEIENQNIEKTLLVYYGITHLKFKEMGHKIPLLQIEKTHD